MAAKNLAEALAADIADAGLAELVSAGNLREIEGDTLVELEQDGDTIRVYENGDEIGEFSTSDEQFNDRLMATLATALNF